MNFKQALQSQRLLLSKKSFPQDTFAGRFMIGLYENEEFNLGSRSASSLSEFYKLGRFLDNLLDEEGIGVGELIQNMKIPGRIQELDVFLESLSESQRREFLKHAYYAIKIMGKYNQDKAIRNRCLEARVLAALEIAVLGKENISMNQYIFIQYFLRGGYMFSDLKHIYSDEKSFGNIIALLSVGLYSFYKSLSFSKNKIKYVRYLTSMMVNSVLCEFKK